MDFVVVDTEGKDIITEIAIINSLGELIVEEFIDNNLVEVLDRIKPILTQNRVVAHSALYDRDILLNSYKSIGRKIKIDTICTFEKAREIFSNRNSYSLKDLSISLFLKHQNCFFDPSLAHRASYDAIFTYLLYKKLLSVENSYRIAKDINPFSSSKVDNPFQNHFDDTHLYKDEFKNLLNIVEEIKKDRNNQSKTAIVIAEAGNGKTHLMMRFLNRVSNTNRFLFVGKPNDKNRILFHTYTKILESFIQKIDDSPYTQLEYLLAKSFSSIYIQMASKNSKSIEALKENHLNIYQKFGRDGSDAKRNNWLKIEKTMIKWYVNLYGDDIISINLLKALIKYTFYKDDNKKNIVINYLSGKDLQEEKLKSVGLESWSDIHIEEFSLKAISLFGKLSIFDEPLIISFDQLEAMSSDRELLLNFGESIKELITHTKNSLIILNLFPQRYREYQSIFDGSFIDLISQNQITLQRPDHTQLKLMLKERAKSYGINLEDIFMDNLIYKDILKHSSIRKILNSSSDYLKLYVHNIPLPKVIELTIEERYDLLLKRIEKLEKIHNIENVYETEKPIDFDIISYINKIYEQKLTDYEKKTIIDDKQDIDKLKFILTSIDNIYNFQLDFFKMSKVLPEHIIIKTDKYQYVVGFLHLEGRLFINRIKNFNHLVANYPQYYFRLFRDERENKIVGKVSKEEQEKLNNSQKGKFIIMTKRERVIYETIYQLIIDFENRDIEVSLNELINAIFKTYKDFWLCRLLE